MRNLRALTMLAAVLAGCTVGPDYHPPDTAMPTRFDGAAQAGNADVTQWWRSFGDPELVRLIEQAMRDNPDVQTAASRVREARLDEIVAGADAWPTVQANAQVSRTHLSSNAISLGNLGTLTNGAVSSGASSGSLSSVGFPGSDFNTYQLGFDASWELDLFGKTRRSVEAARDTTGAEIWDRRDTQVSLAAEVANT